MSQKPASQRPIVSHRTTIVLLSWAAYSGLFSMPLWVGGLSDSYGLDPTVPGYLSSIQLVFAMLAALFVSSRSTAFQLKHLIRIGLATILVANVLSALAQDHLGLLYAARGLSGLGEGTLLASLNAFITRTDDPDRYFAFSQTMIAIFGIGLFGTAPILVEGFGVTAVFGFISVVAALGWFDPSQPQNR